jgi:hypothetical protein
MPIWGVRSLQTSLKAPGNPLGYSDKGVLLNTARSARERMRTPGDIQDSINQCMILFESLRGIILMKNNIKSDFEPA